MSTQRTRSWSATSHHSQRSKILTRSPSLETLPINYVAANNSDYQKKGEAISKEGVHDKCKLSWKNRWLRHKWLSDTTSGDSGAGSLAEDDNLKTGAFNKEILQPQLPTVVLQRNIWPLDFHSRVSDAGQSLDSSPDSLQECVISHHYHNGTNEDSDQFDSIDTLATPDQCDMPCPMWNRWLRTERSNSTDSAVVLSVGSRSYCLERQMSATAQCDGIGDRSTSVNCDSVQRKKSFASSQSMSCPSLAMPSVIVSDHSHCEDEMVPDNSSLQRPDLLSVTIDDIPKNASKLRRFSTCSSGSNASTLSTLSLEDDTSQSDISDSY